MSVLTRTLGTLPGTMCRFCQAVTVAINQQCHNSNKASITRIKRHVYARTYPVLLVHPDGSTINLRYKEPRKIIKLPVDISTLTEEERLIRLANRKPKQKIVIEEDIEDTFDSSEYKFLWNKK